MVDDDDDDDVDDGAAAAAAAAAADNDDNDDDTEVKWWNGYNLDDEQVETTPCWVPQTYFANLIVKIPTTFLTNKNVMNKTSRQIRHVNDIAVPKYLQRRLKDLVTLSHSRGNYKYLGDADAQLNNVSYEVYMNSEKYPTLLLKQNLHCQCNKFTLHTVKKHQNVSLSTMFLPNASGTNTVPAPNIFWEDLLV